jgi:hypothetical protein
MARMKAAAKELQRYAAVRGAMMTAAEKEAVKEGE